ncbi:hypothetical protein VN0406_13980 [Helicobacter pylori]|nr:hypothetical protein VN0406_13980 [Helicobacter pylori]
MIEKPTIQKGIRGYKRASKQALPYTPPIPKSPQKQKKLPVKPLKPPRKFKILSFRGVFLKNLGFL